MSRIADLTVTGVLYALLLFAPLPYGSVEGWPLAIVELLALFAVLTWVVKMIAEGELVIVRTPLNVPFLLFVGVLFLQLALGNNALRNWALSPSAEAQLPSIFFSGSLAPASTRHAVGLFLTYAAVYFLVVNQFRERLQIDRLVRFLLVMGSLLAFYGLLDYLGGGYGVFGSKKLSYAGRVTGTFVNPDHFAAWLAMLIPLALGFLLSTKLLRRQRRRHSASTTTLSLRDYWITDEESAVAVKKFTPHRFPHRVWQELLLLFAITIMAVALVFTLSRAGVVSLILSLVVLVGILLVRQAARPSHLLLAALVLLTLTYAAWIGLDPILERFGLAFTGLQSRITQYWASLPMLRIAPLFGTGLGSYGDLFPRFQPIELTPGSVHFTHAHNDHLQFWIETGLVGGLILLVALWRVGRDLIGAHLLGRGHCFYRQADIEDIYRRDPYNVGIAIGALGGVVAVFFHSFLDFSLRIPANGILLATLLAIATVALHNRFFRNITQPLVTVRHYPIAGRFRQVSAGVIVAGLALVAVFSIVSPPLAENRFQSAVAFMESQASAPTMTTSLVQRLENERRALELLGRVISISPGHPAALRLRASKLEEQASRAWNRAVGPDATILRTQEVRTKVAMALLDQAEHDYRRALNDAPYEAALHERLAWLLGTRALIQAQSAGQAEAAVETRRLALTHFNRAVSLDPANPARHRVLALFAFSQARLPPPATPLRATALAAVRNAVALNPELLPELLDRALAVTSEREDLQALVPNTSVDRLYLATLLDKKGLRLQADESYQKALALASPGEKPIYRRLYANALIRARKLPEALSELESTIGLDPENPEIRLAIAEVLSSMGENSGALVNFQTALLLAKQSGDGAAAVAKAPAPDSDGLPPHRRLFVKLVQKELGQADSSTPVSRAYRINFALARYYTKRGQFALAIPIWEALVKENSADAGAYFQLAVALDGAGAWQAAFNAYKQAIELDRRNGEYKARFAQRLFENEKFFHAIELWQAILSQEPADLTTRLRLANAYVRVGELRDATREYERVLQLYPSHREAREALAALRSRLVGS